ncbi:MAG: polysaccharide deacetylase [Planctomycetaceae bacterium]
MSRRETQEQPWEWAEDHWREIVGWVRAGRSLRPPAWPGGAKCAVALSFDSDHESNELRDGGRSISRMSWGQYGNRVGVPRIEALLDEYSVKATFFVPAVIAKLYPDEQRALAERGHEIGIHGWIHERNSLLSPAVERDLMFRAADALEEIIGTRPLGMRTPSWDFSRATLPILKELGVVYDSSLMADEDCYELLSEGNPTGIVEVPVEWVRDDAVYFMTSRYENLRPHLGPRDVFDIFRREFDGAYERNGVFQLTMHPHIIAYHSRIWILRELIDHIHSRGDIWFCTHLELARYVDLYLQADTSQSAAVDDAGGTAP